MNGRFFDQREIICEYWDGQTDYKRDAQSIMLQNERLQKFAEQIEENVNENEKSETIENKND